MGSVREISGLGSRGEVGSGVGFCGCGVGRVLVVGMVLICGCGVGSGVGFCGCGVGRVGGKEEDENVYDFQKKMKRVVKKKNKLLIESGRR